MKTCDTCKNYKLLFFPCEGCHNNDGWEPKPHSNADRIRSKSDEELAEFFGTLPCCPPGEDLEEPCFPLDSCEGTDFMVKCWLKWLRQEVEDNEL